MPIHVYLARAVAAESATRRALARIGALREGAGGLTRAQLHWLAAAVLAGVAVRVTFVVATHHSPLVGDQIEYDLEGRFIAAGRWFWTTAPFGHPHAGEWKAPGYPVWVGAWYWILGAHPFAVRLVQAAAIGPLTILLTAYLGLRLFSPRVALAAAWIYAVYPNAWQWETGVFSESLATPLSVAVLIAVLPERPVTWPRASATGALLAANVLVRPTAIILIPCVAVAWWLRMHVRAGTARIAVALGVMVLCVAPWTIRNHEVSGRFIPISLQDMSAYGTFNSEAANDPVRPYAWRVSPRPLHHFLTVVAPHLRDAELRSRLQRFATDYIRAHPASVPEAFFWNGLVRTWDIRRPARILDEVRFEGRKRAVAIVGLAMYWALLALALYELFELRRRPHLAIPIVVLALSASVVLTSDAVTRYRAPLEPLVTVLASAGGAALVTDRRRGRAVRGRESGTAGSR